MYTVGYLYDVKLYFLHFKWVEVTGLWIAEFPPLRVLLVFREDSLSIFVSIHFCDHVDRFPQCVWTLFPGGRYWLGGGDVLSCGFKQSIVWSVLCQQDERRGRTIALFSFQKSSLFRVWCVYSSDVKVTNGLDAPVCRQDPAIIIIKAADGFSLPVDVVIFISI